MKILFASIPFDGHVNPLTGLAQYLVASGHDVRWYTQSIYAEKLDRLGVRHYPFKRALQYNQYNLDTILAERLTYRKQVDRLNFDLQHVFIKRAPEFFEDLKDIHDEFPFDVLVADVMFTALPLVKIGMRKPVIAVGVLPLVESSCDLAPAGLGMMPAASWGGKVKQRLLRFLTDRVLFGKSHELYRDILKQHGIVAAGNTMDFLVKTATYFLQSGTPGFEYNRSDLGKNIRFIGPLLPAPRPDSQTHNLAAKAARFGKVILVTQGTIEKDPEKLIVPALEAFKGSQYLLVVTTGGSKTNELRARYTHENVIIEDFIPFESILPYTSVFVTNGGYGGVMLSIRYNVPLVVAGIHEGKNEINARVQYFQLGINLDTETPTARQIHRGVTEIFEDPLYRLNVRKLGQEFRKYDPLPLCERYIQESVIADEVLDRDLIVDRGMNREQVRYNDVLMR